MKQRQAEADKTYQAAVAEATKQRAAFKALQKNRKATTDARVQAEEKARVATETAEQAKDGLDESAASRNTASGAIAKIDHDIVLLEQQIKAARTTLDRETNALAEADKAIALATEKLKQPAKDSERAWARFTKHVLALTWWDDLAGTCGLADSTVWHFHPLAFIEHFRKCHWLSREEFISLNPSRILIDGEYTKAITREEMEKRITGAGEKRPAGIYPQICKTLHKYGITTPLRIAHFFGQVGEETGQWEFMVEKGEDAYFAQYEWNTPKGEELGNTEANDGKRFKGRGLLQLTGKKNYRGYQNYRNTDYTTDPKPTLLATGAYETCDVGGYYWTQKQRMKTLKIEMGEQGINYWADAGRSEEAKKQVTKCVNPALHHYEHRSQYFEHAYYMLGDEINPSSPHQAIE
ncbi:MAG: hypothetical protein QM739_12155 [Propionivibrio sp.]